MRSEQRKFAVFDIDGTLVRWQLFHAIVYTLGKNGYIDPESHAKINQARMAWKTRNNTKSYEEYESIMLDVYTSSLKNIKQKNYITAVNEVFEEYKDQLFVYTKELLEDLKAKGYVLFAISGSQQDIIEKFAKYHGFTDWTGAKLLTQNGIYTGAINTPVLDKKSAVEKLIAKHNVTLNGSIAVGDTASDIKMLELASNPLVFNPSKELFEVATKRHWPIVIERKNVIYKLNYQDNGYNLS